MCNVFNSGIKSNEVCTILESLDKFYLLDIIKLWFKLKREASVIQWTSPNMKIWFLRKSRPSVRANGENEFAGSRKGWKWYRWYLSARSAKTRWKTPHTLKHMLKFHPFPIHWYAIYSPNVAASRSNRTFKSHIFTCISMGRLFTVVRPLNTFCSDMAFFLKMGQNGA